MNKHSETQYGKKKKKIAHLEQLIHKPFPDRNGYSDNAAAILFGALRSSFAGPKMQLDGNDNKQTYG